MKKWMLFMLVAGLAFGACGCTAEKPEAFEVVQSFEYHFLIPKNMTKSTPNIKKYGNYSRTRTIK